MELTRYLGPGLADPAIETRQYDRLGRLTGLTDPGGAKWIYTYDLRGLRTAANDPDLGLWRYTYDLAGRLMTQDRCARTSSPPSPMTR